MNNVLKLKDKPFELGYHLSLLKNEGLNYTQLSEKTNLDRNQIRGYIRLTGWSDEVKDFVHDNEISVYQLLNAALKAGVYDNDKKVIEYLSDNLKSNKKSVSKISKKEVARMPSKISTINDSYIESTEIETLKKIIENQRAELDNLKAEKFTASPGQTDNSAKSWNALNGLKYAVLIVVGIALTLFLTYQNYAFFAATDNSALINIRPHPSLPTFSISLNSLIIAVVVEIALLLSAFFMYASRSMLERNIARVILLGMIAGIGVFMHSSIENKVYSTSDVVKNLNEEKTIILDTIASDRKTLESYPIDYKTKRQEISNKIQENTDKISTINKKLSSEKSVISGNESSTIYYNTGIRVAIMILNVMLLHMIFFTRKDRKLS